MSQKVYNVVAAVTTGVIGVAEAAVALLNPPYEAAIVASLPVLEGAILTIASNFIIRPTTKKK